MPSRSPLLWGIAALLLLALGVFIRLRPPHIDQLPAAVAIFPIESSEWRCEAVAPETAAYKDPNVRRDWVGVCKNPAGVPIQAYVGYADRGVRVVSPALHYPGEDNQKWSYLFRHKTLIVFNNQSFDAALTALQHASGRRVAVLYWYQIDGVPYADEYRYRLNLILGKLLVRPSSSVVVRLSVAVTEDSEQLAFNLERELAAILLPVTTQRFQ